MVRFVGADGSFARPPSRSSPVSQRRSSVQPRQTCRGFFSVSLAALSLAACAGETGPAVADGFGVSSDDTVDNAAPDDTAAPDDATAQDTTNGLVEPTDGTDQSAASGVPPVSSTGSAPSSIPDPTSSAPASAGEACSTLDASAVSLPRLSRLEYQLTLEELFELPTAPNVDELPQDSDFKGFRTLFALQNVTTEHLRAYQATAEALATALLADSARLNAVVGCDLASSGCLQTFVTNFGRLAYRRSLDDVELQAYLDLATTIGGSAEEQFTGVVSAMLSSANFLFRVESGNDPTAALATLTGEQLAARLSFTLIGRAPSAELLDLGKSGALDTEQGLMDAANELLASDKAREYFDAFFQQWLGFEQLRPPKQPEAWWDDALMLSMQNETQRFLRDYAWTEGVSFRDALVANHSFMSADLADFYGLPAPAADGLVEFPEGHDRFNGGLLTQAALLAQKRDGDRIAHRGAWIQSTFLCLDLTLPTELLDSVSDELAGLSFRQIVDRRNTDAACSTCHSLIDPIGVGLAAYDEAGRFQPDFDIYQYNITPMFPQAQTEFSSAGELAVLLRDRATVAECITKKLFLYTSGREATQQDACTIARATEKFTSDQYRFASILEGLVASPQFRLRRAPAETQTMAEGEN
jgi:hypothetical protein